MGCGVSIAGESAGKRLYPLVRELAADGIAVAVSCRVLKLPRPPYYRWLTEAVTTADRVAAERANALFDAHRDDPEFGYRFLADEAEAAGQSMSARTGWRICSREQLVVEVRQEARPEREETRPPVHDDLVERDFTAESLNQLWLRDITEHSTDEGTLYLCAIKDACSGRIVGYSIGSRMHSRLAVSALNSAVARRSHDVAGCIVHSDRGSQFRSRWNRLRIAAAQRPRPAALAHPRATPNRDRHLDRTDLASQAPPGPPRPVDADRIRGDHQHSRISGVIPKLSLSVQQSHR